MEIKAKLSLAVDGFKSGLSTAKKELDTFGASGSKFNSKFAQDIRSSFDNIGPGIKRVNREVSRDFDRLTKEIASNNKAALGNIWNPLSQGFNKATAKIAVNSAVIGGFFKNMTKSASTHAKDVDALIERNTRNRIIGAQRAADFEARVAQSNRRIDKVSMREQYGARDSSPAQAAFVAKNPIPTKAAVIATAPTVEVEKKAESQYTSWLSKENAKRLQERIKQSSSAIAKETRERLSTANVYARVIASETAAFAKGAAQRLQYELSFQATRLRESIANARARVKYDQEFMTMSMNDKGFEQKLASTRYALYDVGNRMIAFGTAIGAGLSQAVMGAAKFESAFTSVERTAGGSVDSLAALKASLIEISTTLPVAFEDVAKIATLGAQLGIAAGELDSFSETVAKFSTITGISVDETAQAFGRLSQTLGVPVEKFENLSSAIAYTGVNAVATDLEILRMSESIAVAADQAGYSADQVIGLSAALASLKVRPEEARGVLLRLFRTISQEVDIAGVRMDDFSKTMGLTKESASALYKEDPSAFFSKFLAGAQATGKLDSTLTALGITATREVRVVQALANNQDVLTSALKDSEEQYLLGTYAGEAYSKVADDLNSKLQVLQQNMDALTATAGGGLAEMIKPIVDFLTMVIKSFDKLPKSLFAVVGIIAAIAAGFIIFKGVLALTIAGMLALKLAMDNLSTASVKAGVNIATLKGVVSSMKSEAMATSGAMNFLGMSFNKAAIGAKILNVSLGVVGIIAVAIPIIEAFANAIGNSEESAKKAGNATLEAAGGISAFMDAVKKDNVTGMTESLGQLTLKTSEASKEITANKDAAVDYSREVSKFAEGVADGSVAIGNMTTAQKESTTAQEGMNTAIADGNTVIDEQVLKLGRATAAFLINAAAKYGESGDKNFFEEQFSDPKNTKIAEALGFDMAKAVAYGMRTPGAGTENYIMSISKKWSEFSSGISKTQTGVLFTSQEDRTIKATEYIKKFGAENKLTAAQMAGLQSIYNEHGTALASLPSYYFDWARSSDAVLPAVQAQAGAAESLNSILEKNGTVTKETTADTEDLSGQLMGYLEAATAVERANQKVAGSFTTFAKGAKKSNGEILGTTEAAVTNMGAWSTFMSDALSASIADGTDVVGAMQKISSAIIVMGNNGINTTEHFKTMQTFMVNAFASAGAEYSGLVSELSVAPDITGMQTAIQKYIDIQIAAGDTTSAFYLKLVEMKGALSGTDVAAMSAAWKSAMDKVGGSTAKAQTALEKFLEALDKLLEKSTSKIGLEAALDSLGASMAKNKKVFSAYTEDGRSNLSNLEAAIKAVATNTKGAPQATANSLESLRQAMIKAGVTAGPAMAMIANAIKATGKKGKASAAELKMVFGSITGSFTEAAKSEARTISDYISDISSILSDALRNRYGKQDAGDSIAGAWRSIGKAATDAAEAIASANREIKTTTADKAVLTYQLGIAVKYGDTKRAAVIQAKLDEATASLAENNTKLAEATAASNKSLTDGTEAGAGNRTQIRAIVSSMNDYLMSLARAGKSNAELKVEAKTLSDDFMKQGKALGFAEKELQAYADAFTGDFTKAVTAVPNTITLKVNTDPALAAIEEFVLKAKDSLGTIGIIAPTASTTAAAVVKTPVTAAQQATIKSLASQVSATTAQIVALQKSPVKNAAAILVLEAKRDRLRQRAAAVTAPVTKANGGYISGPGTSTSDSIPAMLSNGEYVIKANAVSKYGVDFMNSINQMKAARPMPSGLAGGGVGGSSVVYLSPEDRQLLRAAMDRPIALYTENSKIAQSANAGNVVLAQRGTN